MKAYNTLTHQREDFVPINPPAVTMYVCGITPYDSPHLGHARAYVAFDIIHRYLEYRGYKVTYVQNITDIDDKIIRRANELGVETTALAEKYTQEYFEEMDRLGILRADRYPKATEHIPDMIKVIEKLKEREAAYELDGDVYFSVDKFPGYGKLSRREQEGMEAGARIEVDRRKRNPLDFALWKTAKPGEPSWESPWGPGRPGWHIECSVMSTKYLGETIDIHGGGQDLIFPHHENEIAQSEAASGNPFARYFIHNGMVTVNKAKMSKSLGNFFTLGEIFAKFSPATVRFFLLKTHYRSPVEFSDALLREAERALARLYDILDNVDFYLQDKKVSESGTSVAYLKRFEEVMDDDFNTAEAVAVLFDLGHRLNQEMDKLDPNLNFLEQGRSELLRMMEILGMVRPPRKVALDPEVEEFLRQREEARRQKDFSLADTLRKKIIGRGYLLEDTPEGPRVKLKR